MAVFRAFYIVCPCGHRNRPHKSPREGIRLALLKQLKPCAQCGQPLPSELPDRPLVAAVRAELAARRLLPAP
jgi:hypothetical protein